MEKKSRKTVIIKQPRRGEIWLVVNRERKNPDDEYDDSLQKGDRTCIVVSNNDCNSCSSVVEVVYTTTKKKTRLPTHFNTSVTPELSTVLCEAIHSVPKRDLVRYHGKLPTDEMKKLDRCLKISIGI